MTDRTLRLIVQQEKRGNALASTQTDLQQLGQDYTKFRGILTGLVAPVAAVGFAAKKAWDLVGDTAALELAEDRFDNLAESIGTTADALLGEMSRATSGMQSQAELMASASEIISLGLADNEDGVVRLANLVSQLGWDMSQVIMTFANDSKMRLDALGLSVTDVEGRMATLTAAGMETSQAFDMAVIEAGEAKLKLLGSAADTTAGSMKILKSAWADNLQAAKEYAGSGLSPIVDFLANLIRVSKDAQAAVDTVITSEDVQRLQDYRDAMKDVRLAIEELGPRGTPLAPQQTVETREALIALLADAAAAGPTLEAQRAIINGLVDSYDDLGVVVEGMGISWRELDQATADAKTADRLAAITAEFTEIDGKLMRFNANADDTAGAIESVSEELQKLQEELEKLELDQLIDDVGISAETWLRLQVALGGTAEAMEYLLKVQRDTGQATDDYEVSVEDVEDAERRRTEATEASNEALDELRQTLDDIRRDTAGQAGDILGDLFDAMADPEAGPERVEELSASLRENYANAILAAATANREFDQTSADVAVALGLMTQAEADARLEAQMLSGMMTGIGEAVRAGAISPELAASFFSELLTAAEGTEEELAIVMGRIQKILSGDWSVAPEDYGDATPRPGNMRETMLREVEGLETEMPPIFASASTRSRDAMIGEGAPLTEVEDYLSTTLPSAATDHPIVPVADADPALAELDLILAKMNEINSTPVSPGSTAGGGGRPGMPGTGGGGTGDDRSNTSSLPPFMPPVTNQMFNFMSGWSPAQMFAAAQAAAHGLGSRTR